MARLRAKEKILFYPTPLSVVEVIATNVAASGGRLLDPCCGDGRPAHLLGQRLGLTTYGVELHPDRAAQAARRLDHCLTGAREFLDTDSQFNLIFDNPPYDQELGGGRMEVAHIQRDLALLTPGGLGIWVIPEPVLDVQLCQLLVTHLEQVALRRFPQPEYDRFKQVVVFGCKRPSPALNTYILTNGLERRRQEGLPTLQAGEFIYTYDPERTPLTRFAISFPDSSAILSELETDGLHTDESWQTLVGGHGLGFGDFQPVLRLNAGHTAMAIAAGIVNGTEVTIDGQRHLIKGSTRKRVKASSDTNSTTDGMETTLREREVLVQTITALNLETGRLTEYNSLDDQDGFARFLLNHQQALVESIEANFPPLFEPERDMSVWLPQLARVRPPGKLAGKLVAEGLLPAQQVRAAALATRLQTAKGVILIGEMGVGKTATAQAITALIGKGNWKLVVVAPAQVCEKWQREARTVLRDFGVSVHLIGRKRRQPDGNGQIRQVSKPVLDVMRAMDEPKPSVMVISYQLAKSGARWQHVATRQRKPLTLRVEVEETLPSYPYRQMVERTVTRVETVYSCPDCGQTLTLDGQPVTDLAELGQRQHRCDACGAALWQQIPFKYGGRVALADFLNRHYSGRYNLILDEAHHTKGADTDVGYASADLVAGANKVIAMTGTLYSGKASSIFYLMYRLLPQFRQLYGYDEVQRFIEHHGLQETITKVKKFDRYHSTYGYQRENVRVREIPGVSPGMVTMLLGHTAFLKLADVGLALPPYTEERLPVPFDDRLLEGLADLDRLHETAVKLAQEGRPGLLSAWLFASLGWPDCPVDEQLAVKNDQGEVVETFPISGVFTQAEELLDEPLAKDQALLEVVRSELAQERGVGIFFSQVNRRDWMERMRLLLKREGIYSEILRQNTCKPDERERWYQAFVTRCRQQGQEPVLLANGSLLKEGLDLIELPTLVETGIEYRINDLRQRDRRSWRLTQSRPVKVIFLYYEDSFQETALQLVAAKLKAAMMVDGHLAQGLAAMEIDDGNLMDALMKAVAQGRTRRPEAWSGMAVAAVSQAKLPTRPQRVQPPPPQQTKQQMDFTAIEVKSRVSQPSSTDDAVEETIVQYSFL